MNAADSWLAHTDLVFFHVINHSVDLSRHFLEQSQCEDYFHFLSVALSHSALLSNCYPIPPILLTNGSYIVQFCIQSSFCLSLLFHDQACMQHIVNACVIFMSTRVVKRNKKT